jgi:hypothetical protein
MGRAKSSGRMISDRREVPRNPTGKERRRSPRMLCDLSCKILRGRKPITARILDVSEHGLCLLSPANLEQGDELDIEVDVPEYGLSRVQVFIWHVRAVKNSNTKKLNWTAGAVLVKSDHAYARLVASADLNVSVEDDPNDNSDELQAIKERVEAREKQRNRLRTLRSAAEKETRELPRSDEMQMFRVRVQVKGEQRSRLLTLGAATEEEARKLALADLDDSWTVTQVENSSTVI